MKSLVISALILLSTVGLGRAEVSSSPVFTLLDSAKTQGAGVAMDATRWGVAGVEVVISSGTATITFEGSVNGTTYYTMVCYPMAGGAAASTTAASSQHRCTVSGLKTFRLNVTACSSCVVTAKAVGSNASSNGT